MTAIKRKRRGGKDRKQIGSKDGSKEEKATEEDLAQEKRTAGRGISDRNKRKKGEEQGKQDCIGEEEKNK